MINKFQFIELKTQGADFLVSSISFIQSKFLYSLLLFYCVTNFIKLYIVQFWGLGYNVYGVLLNKKQRGVRNGKV